MAAFQNEPIAGQGQDGGSFKDRRARLSAKPLARELIYGPNVSSNILRPLWETGGLLWPYTPIIADNATVQYESYDPVHSNQPFMAFKSVAAKEIMVSGQFTAMNQEEARYSLSAIHFLRTITKMYFGISGDADAVALRGTPPPILLFNAHGTAMFHNIPVIVTSYSTELPQDVDYVEVDLSEQFNSSPRLVPQFNESLGLNNEDGSFRSVNTSVQNDNFSAWIPTKFTITVNMIVQNSPNRWRRNFNLNDFRTGKLIKKGGWI